MPDSTQSGTEQNVSSEHTHNPLEAINTTYTPHQPLDIGESNVSTPGTVNNSISPRASGGFPTFEHTLNSNMTQSPGIRGVQSSESSSHRSEKEEFQDIFSELMTGTEHEIGFLTRHYSEVIGPWYDISFKVLV